VNGARHELLAGACFAPNEHGQVRCSHLLEDCENLAHADAVPDDVVELLAPAERDLDRPGPMLEANDRIADPQWHARFEPCFADPHTSDPGPVRRAEVAEQEARLLGDDLAMRAARPVVRELQVADAATADCHPLAGNVETSPFLRPVFDHQAALAKLALGRFAIDEYGRQSWVVVHSASFRSASMAAA